MNESLNDVSIFSTKCSTQHSAMWVACGLHVGCMWVACGLHAVHASAA